MKVVINRCFGGFGLSKEALLALWDSGFRGNATPARPTGKREDFLVYSPDNKWLLCTPRDRADPRLVAVVEEMGQRSWGSYAKLKVVEIPDDVDDDYTIEDYDGMECIAEVHRIWS